MYAMQQKYSQAEAQFRKFIKTYGKTAGFSMLFEAHKNLGEALVAQKKMDEARKSFVDVVDLLKTVPKDEYKTLSGGAVVAVAWAFFNLGDDLFAEAGKIKYTRKNLAEATDQKLVLVGQAQQYFDTVRKLNLSYWTVLSYYRVGTSHREVCRRLGILSHSSRDERRRRAGLSSQAGSVHREVPCRVRLGLRGLLGRSSEGPNLQ